MAALRLGVGDVFTVCKGVVDLCKSNHDEFKDMKGLLAEMELMREHLNVINARTQPHACGSEKAKADMAPIIVRSLSPIHRDLSHMRQVLSHHQERKNSVHVLGQARYMLHYKAKLNGFQECLNRHRESICVIRELVECENHGGEGSGMERLRRQSIIKLAGLVEREEMRVQEQGYEDGWVEQIERSQSFTEETREDLEAPSRLGSLVQKAGQSPLDIDSFAKSQGLSQNVFSKPAFKLDVFGS